ncbi:MAG: hypothetical protein HYX59_14180 [Elusimicrobia bacterium]|nr:hypothetical protein [Elusimicrobiota bacterium]
MRKIPGFIDTSHETATSSDSYCLLGSIALEIIATGHGGQSKSNKARWDTLSPDQKKIAFFFLDWVTAFDEAPQFYINDITSALENTDTIRSDRRVLFNYPLAADAIRRKKIDAAERFIEQADGLGGQSTANDLVDANTVDSIRELIETKGVYYLDGHEAYEKLRLRSMDFKGKRLSFLVTVIDSEPLENGDATLTGLLGNQSCERSDQYQSRFDIALANETTPRIIGTVPRALVTSTAQYMGRCSHIRLRDTSTGLIGMSMRKYPSIRVESLDPKGE